MSSQPLYGEEEEKRRFFHSVICFAADFLMLCILHIKRNDNESNVIYSDSTITDGKQCVRSGTFRLIEAQYVMFPLCLLAVYFVSSTCKDMRHCLAANT